MTEHKRGGGFVTALDAINAELAVVREKMVELAIEERVLQRLLVDIAGRAPEVSQERSVAAEAPPAAHPERPAPEAVAATTQSVSPPRRARNGRNQWLESEDRILRETYPRGGVSECVKLLPGRNTKAIQLRASKLQVKRVGGGAARETAAPPPPAAPAAPAEQSAFDKQVERVSRGEVGIAPAFTPRKAPADRTYGGVASAML